MRSAPSVLLLDDGELGRVRSALVRLGADFVHLHDRKIGPRAVKPRDLLVTNLRHALDLPSFESAEGGAADPTWVCMHDRDFHPLRKRMRDLGAHFLVHSGVDAESLRLLFGQLLHRGAERRGTLRLPLACEVTYRAGGESRKAVLADLSIDSCRIVSAQYVPPETSVTLELPPELFGGSRVELPGRSVRCTPYEPRSRAPGFSVVVAFERLEPEASAHLEDLVDGHRLGTPVAPLELPLEFVDESEREILLEDEAEDRRRHPRREYQRRVVALAHNDEQPENVVLGHDLSLEGVRIERRPGHEVGSRTTLALYGRSREEPVVVEAKIVCDHGEGGLGLEFVSLTPEQKQQLEKLIAHLPPLESLQDDRPEGEGLVVSRLMPSK